MGFWHAGTAHAAATAQGGRRSNQGKRREGESGRRRRLCRRPQPGSPLGAGFLAVLECAARCRRVRRPGCRCGGGRRDAGGGDDADRTADRLRGSAGALAVGGGARGIDHRADIQCRGAGEQACLMAGADLPDPELGEQRQQGQESGQTRCAEAAATRCHGAAIVERAAAPDLSPVKGSHSIASTRSRIGSSLRAVPGGTAGRAANDVR